MISVAGDTGVLLHRLATQFNDATRSGRDDDLWAVQTAAQGAWQAGVGHGDLVLLLVQVQLDCHAVSAAAGLLASAPAAAATPTGQMLTAGVALQRGDTVAAGRVLMRLAAAEPAWRTLALLAAVYEEVADPAAADLLYARAAELLDAKQLAGLAWLECQRARLRIETGRLDGADQHLRRAEQAAAGWSVAAVRGRWLEAAGELAAATRTRIEVVEATGRPDHAQAVGTAMARAGRTAETSRWWAEAAAGFAAARRRWPHRYAHHEVEWQLTAGRDPAAAVLIAEADYRERPAAQPAARLAMALRAGGQPMRADALLAEHRRRRAAAKGALADGVAALNAAARG